MKHEGPLNHCHLRGYIGYRIYTVVPLGGLQPEESALALGLTFWLSNPVASMQWIEVFITHGSFGQDGRLSRRLEKASSLADGNLACALTNLLPLYHRANILYRCHHLAVAITDIHRGCALCPQHFLQVLRKKRKRCLRFR